jgi:hypothetical protein
MSDPQFKLTRDLRNGLIREAHKYNREAFGTADPLDVADHLFGIMLDDPEKYGTDPFDATEISDYAYGIALFIN